MSESNWVAELTVSFVVVTGATVTASYVNQHRRRIWAWLRWRAQRPVVGGHNFRHELAIWKERKPR